MSSLRPLSVLCAALILAACDDDDGVVTPLADSGVDAAIVDGGGTPDAGMGDSGPSDAGTATRAVTINFSPRVGTAPFSCTGTFALGTPAKQAQPVDFRFYVQDVSLVDAARAETFLTLTDSPFQAHGVALLDFEDATGSCNQGDTETNTRIIGTVPEGEYVGVSFRIGIPFELNHADLTSLPPPLDRTSLFWGWNLGHIFFAGVSRTVPVGKDAAVENYTHVGSTACEGDPTMGTPVTGCDNPNRAFIELPAFDAAADTIVVDFAAFKSAVDVGTDGCHSFETDCTAPFRSLGIDYATGDETPATQTVFSVE